jgi:hypothetical protein
LGRAPKPQEVWERQFDGFDNKLKDMAARDWDQISDHYLGYYFDDMAYVDLQPDLFRHVFPACLKYWYETLNRNESTEQSGRDFHAALMKGDIPNKLLSEKQRLSLWDFFHDGFIDRIEAQDGFPHNPESKTTVRRGMYSWIERFNSLGVVAPVIQHIWESWWALDHSGKAVCAVMYASGLIYLRGENPIYAAWTPDKGGGGPYLTASEGWLFDWAWRDDNLAFLTNRLSVNYLIEMMQNASKVLSSHPDFHIAARVANDAMSRADIIEIRMGDLLENLARVELAQDHWE